MTGTHEVPLRTPRAPAVGPLEVEFRHGGVASALLDRQPAVAGDGLTGRFRQAVARMARRSTTAPEVRGARFRTGRILVSGAAAGGRLRDIQALARRHADGDSGLIGGWNPTDLQPGFRAWGRLADRAARNAMAIADGGGDVVSTFALGEGLVCLWTIFAPEPATLVCLAEEFPPESKAPGR